LKTQVKLHPVQQTLLIPFLARGKQFEQVESIVTDTFSVEIFKTLNYDFEKLSNAKNSLVGSSLQCVIIDNRVSNLLHQHLQNTVVENGADLSICFKPLDLVEALQLKQDFIAASMVKNDWIEPSKETNTTSYIFVVEDLRMYLRQQQVKQLFDKLIENFSDSLFAFDSLLSLMVKKQKRVIKHMSANFDYLYLRYLKNSTLKLRLSSDEIIPLANFEVKFQLRLFLTLINRLLCKYFPPLTNSYPLTLCQIA
jgi:O-methyltransferase involved in polyketide biosynthesis